MLLAILIATMLMMVVCHGWTLTWHDEFDGTSIDTSKWTVYDNQTHGSQELQLYLASNVFVRNGSLVLRTERRQVMYGDLQVWGCCGDVVGCGVCAYPPQQYNFTSGWVDSQSKFSQTYGRFAVRAKLPDPRVLGIWPAHWMMPERNLWNCWPLGGEIDIMEATGGEVNNTVYGTYHYGANCTIHDDDQTDATPCTCGCGCDLRSGPNGQYFKDGNTSVTIDFSADFHVFAVEWTPKTISWFVDEELYWERSSNGKGGQPRVPIPDSPFYMILNTAIDWWTPHTGEGPLPVEHIIDWVRVYEADKQDIDAVA